MSQQGTFMEISHIRESLIHALTATPNLLLPSKTLLTPQALTPEDRTTALRWLQALGTGSLDPIIFNPITDPTTPDYIRNTLQTLRQIDAQGDTSIHWTQDHGKFTFGTAAITYTLKGFEGTTLYMRATDENKRQMTVLVPVPEAEHATYSVSLAAQGLIEGASYIYSPSPFIKSQRPSKYSVFKLLNEKSQIEMRQDPHHPFLPVRISRNQEAFATSCYLECLAPTGDSLSTSLELENFLGKIKDRRFIPHALPNDWERLYRRGKRTSSQIIGIKLFFYAEEEFHKYGLDSLLWMSSLYERIGLPKTTAVTEAIDVDEVFAALSGLDDMSDRRISSRPPPAPISREKKADPLIERLEIALDLYLQDPTPTNYLNFHLILQLLPESTQKFYTDMLFHHFRLRSAERP